MKIFKQLLALAPIVLALGSSAHASMINVGGVVWDPDAVNISDSDFTARYNFNQFFTTAANQVANVDNATPDYTKAINPLTVVGGNVLQGVGEINKFNGVDYGNTSSTVGGAFCPSCELTFVFGGFAITGPNTLSNGWLRIYVDDTPDFNISTDPAAKAADGDLFLSLEAVSNQFLSASGFQSGFLTNYFKVVGGLAASNFDTDSMQFASDLLSSAAAQFTNPNFIATSSGQISGNTIPEPSSIFLLGVALLGLAYARRKPMSR